MTFVCKLKKKVQQGVERHNRRRFSLNE